MTNKRNFAYRCQTTLVILFSLLMSSQSLSAELRFSQLNKERGLTQGSITALAMGASNLLWIGTEDGLVRYDGYKVTTFRHDPSDLFSVQDNVITALAIDGGDRLWVGSESDGVSFYEKNTNQFIRIDPELIGSSIFSIFTDANSKNTIIKSEIGLLKIDQNNEVERLLAAQDSPNVVTSLMEGDSVISILTTGEAIILIDGKQKRTKLLDGAISNAWSIKSCRKLLQARPNDESNINLYCYQNGSIKLSPITTLINEAGLSLAGLYIASIVEDQTGSIWISTSDGLLQIKNNKLTVSRHLPYDEHSLSSNKLSYLLSVDDTLFIGTEFDGVNFLNTGEDSFEYFNLLNTATDYLNRRFTTNNDSCGTATEVDYDTIWSILEDSAGDLWIGNNAGLAVKRKGTTEFVDHSRIGDNTDHFDFCSVWALAEINGKIWAGIWGGLVSFDKNTKEYSHIKPAGSGEAQTLSGKFVRLLLHDKARNSLWIGTNRNGLNRLDFESGVIHKYPVSAEDPAAIPHGRIRSLYLDTSNQLWVGSGGGLSLWNEQSNTFKTLKSSSEPTNLSDEDVRTISEAGDGKYWIGTGNGIDLFNSQSFTVEKRLNQKNGLPNSTIYAMVKDTAKNYWVTTANGLSYFDPTTLKFKNYGYQQGLQSNEFNFNAWHRSKDNRIYVGGVSGLNILNPPIETEQSYKPKPVMTQVLATNPQGHSIVIANNPVPGERFAIDSAFRILEFNYTIPSYNGAQHQSRHHLNSMDTPWTTTSYGPQQAVFTNVSAGQHAFQIASENQDDIAAEYEIYITPKIYERNWFRLLLAVLALLLLITLFMRYSKKRVEKSLDDLSRQHYRVLEHEIRPHLFRANDNLQTVRNSASLLEEDKHYIDTSISPLMERTIGFLNDVRNIADFEFALLRPKTSYMLEDVIDSVILLLSDHSDRIIVNQLDDVNIVTHEDALYLVVSNLLTNALKYSDSSEPVNLRILAQGNNLCVECIDNGIGIDPNKVNAIYQPYQRLGLHKNKDIIGLGLGLTIVKQIVHTYNGGITVEDRNPHGSQFTVILKGIVSGE